MRIFFGALVFFGVPVLLRMAMDAAKSDHARPSTGSDLPELLTKPDASRCVTAYHGQTGVTTFSPDAMREADDEPIDGEGESPEILAFKAERAALQAENAKLKAGLLKVSEKGALSVYGMGRFPVTLYREQWEKLLALDDAIRQFIVDNESKLTKKTLASK